MKIKSDNLVKALRIDMLYKLDTTSKYLEDIYLIQKFHKSNSLKIEFKNGLYAYKSSCNDTTIKVKNKTDDSVFLIYENNNDIVVTNKFGDILLLTDQTNKQKNLYFAVKKKQSFLLWVFGIKNL